MASCVDARPVDVARRLALLADGAGIGGAGDGHALEPVGADGPGRRVEHRPGIDVTRRQLLAGDRCAHDCNEQCRDHPKRRTARPFQPSRLNVRKVSRWVTIWSMHRSGRHFLQIPGPTNTPDRVLRALAQPTIDHRSAEFAALGREVLAGIKRIFQTFGAGGDLSRLRQRRMGSGRSSTRCRPAIGSWPSTSENSPGAGRMWRAGSGSTSK